MDNLKKEYKELVDKFFAADKNETLTLGLFDLDVKIFIVHLIEELINSCEDEEKYFQIINILNLFLENFVYGEEWGMWCGFDLSKVSEISSGLIENKDRLIEVRNFYLY